MTNLHATQRLARETDALRADLAALRADLDELLLTLEHAHKAGHRVPKLDDLDTQIRNIA